MAKTNLCTCWKRIATIFLHCLTNPAFLYASKHAKNQASFVHDRARSGASPDLTSQSTLHACLKRVNAM